MNNIGKYCLGGFALAIVGFLCWYFSSIIAYILIAVIISFLGRPVMNCLERLEIKGYHIPDGLRAAIALFQTFGILGYSQMVNAVLNVAIHKGG